MESGLLSGFTAGPSAGFFGGPEVQALEDEWEAAFRVDCAVAMNSATSGLIAALGAVGIKPGDEVIVSPWTMSATATAPLVWGAIPVFADIESDTYGLNPESVRAAITDRTRAIIVTDIFGHAAQLEDILSIARQNGIPVIEDAAQAPGALINGQLVGTIADIGVYSLNRHKHIQCGEGGICVTNNTEYAHRMQLIRNHGETASNDPTVFGFNFRLGEIEAAIAREQLRKLPEFAAGRSDVGRRLTIELQGLPGIRTPTVRSGCTHVYYVFAIALDQDLPRDQIIGALQAKGVPIGEGYQNLHRLPVHASRYKPGMCPVAEHLHATVITLETCAYDLPPEDTRLIGDAFRKVWKSLA